MSLAASVRTSSVTQLSTRASIRYVSRKATAGDRAARAVDGDGEVGPLPPNAPVTGPVTVLGTHRAPRSSPGRCCHCRGQGSVELAGDVVWRTASPLLRWECAHVGACADRDGARSAGPALVVHRRVLTPHVRSHRLSAPSATGAGSWIQGTSPAAAPGARTW